MLIYVSHLTSLARVLTWPDAYYHFARKLLRRYALRSCHFGVLFRRSGRLYNDQSGTGRSRLPAIWRRFRRCEEMDAGDVLHAGSICSRPAVC